MPDSYQDHVRMEALERFAFGELTERELAPVEEHLLVCEECRQAVAEMDVFAEVMRSPASGASTAYVHFTADGPVSLEIRAGEGGGWLARFYGTALEGQTRVESPLEAHAWLRRSFCQMFPEHLCTDECGPAE